MRMTTYIALLRGINVGGHKKVAMSDLRALAVDLGFANPRSILQSGNLVFEGDRKPPAEIETLIGDAVREQLDVESDIFVRTAAEWRKVVGANPFGAEATRDPGHLLVMCLRRAPKAVEVASLRAAIVGPERVEAVGREAYFVYPAGVGTSRLTHVIIERTLGTRGTARNWNTVRKLAEMVG
jgi:uncharacterized protein (DUF1697 family)